MIKLIKATLFIAAIFMIIVGVSSLSAEENVQLKSMNEEQQINQDTLYLAVMEKPPRKLTPQGAMGGAGCMGQYKAFYNEIRTNPTAPVPLNTSQQCINCLFQQADMSRPWTNASFICRSHCCN